MLASHEERYRWYHHDIIGSIGSVKANLLITWIVTMCGWYQSYERGPKMTLTDHQRRSYSARWRPSIVCPVWHISKSSKNKMTFGHSFLILPLRQRRHSSQTYIHASTAIAAATITTEEYIQWPRNLLYWSLPLSFVDQNQFNVFISHRICGIRIISVLCVCETLKFFILSVESDKPYVNVHPYTLFFVWLNFNNKMYNTWYKHVLAVIG